MPKQKRWDVKQKCDLAIKNLEKSGEHIVKAFEQYENPHPEIYEKACAIFQSMEMMIKVISKLRDSI